MHAGFLIVAALAISAWPQWAAAAEDPWCVQYSMDGDATNCGFVSFEQCMETARGAAGVCRRNPHFYERLSRPTGKPAIKRRIGN